MSTQPRGYAAARSYVAVESLDELYGPTSGEIRLPKRLDWGPPRTFRLEDRADAAILYETVLRESRSAEDLRTHLDAGTLRTLWPALLLPTPLRRLWEQRFPELRSAAAA